MAPRILKSVHQMEIDEVSLVDRPAAQDALIAIAKRHQEDTVSYFDAEGNEVTEADLEPGDYVRDDSGEVFLYDPNDEFTAEPEAEKELAAAGVSKAFADTRPAPSLSLVETVEKALSATKTAGEREEVLKSALLAASQQAEQASEIAKSERTLRLQREYIGKAAEYNVPVQPSELGPVLMRMAVDPSTGEAWPKGSQQFADCEVIHKVLSASGEILATELGYSGGEQHESDPFRKVEQMLEGEVAKSAEKITKAAAVEAYFDSDPREYEAYLATRPSR